MLDLLTALDYKKILEFTSAINQNYDNFKNNVLLAMTDIFGYRLTCYSLFNQGADQRVYVESTHSNGMPQASSTNYIQNLYKSDLFFQRLGVLQSQNVRKPFYVIEDVATMEEFFDTEYGKFLASLFLEHQLVFTPGRSLPYPNHILNIYRSKSEGNFTKKELQLFVELSKVLDRSVILYKKHMHSKMINSFLDWQADVQVKGIAVVNYKNEILYSSPLFNPLLMAVMENENLNSALDELLDSVAEPTAAPDGFLIRPISVLLKGYKINVDTSMRYYGENWQKYILVTIEKEYSDAKARETEIPKKSIKIGFDLTNREKEVSELMMQGYDNEEIAEKLFINISTVKFHIKNIYLKLDVNSRAAAIVKLIN